MRTFAAALAVVLMAAVAGCAAPEPASETPTRAFRIQVKTTPDKDAADAAVGRVLDWWAELPSADRPDALADQDLAPEVVWSAPYYRVRVGRFATRAAAEDALAALRQEFPDAFVARAAAPAQE